MIKTSPNRRILNNIVWFPRAASTIFSDSAQNDLDSPDPRGGRWGHRLSLLMARFGRAVGEWSKDRATRAQLWALDDRMLADIGLSRGDIIAAGYGNTRVDRQPNVQAPEIAEPNATSDQIDVGRRAA